MYASTPSKLAGGTRANAVNHRAAPTGAFRSFTARPSVNLSARSLTNGTHALKVRRPVARIAAHQPVNVRAEKVVGIDLGTTNSAVSIPLP